MLLNDFSRSASLGALDHRVGMLCRGDTADDVRVVSLNFDLKGLVPNNGFCPSPAPPELTSALAEPRRSSTRYTAISTGSSSRRHRSSPGQTPQLR